MRKAEEKISIPFRRLHTDCGVWNCLSVDKTTLSNTPVLTMQVKVKSKPEVFV